MPGPGPYQFEQTRHDFDPTKFAPHNGPVIPIPPQPTAANAFSPMTNNPNPNPHQFARGQPPHARNTSFSAFPNVTANGFDPNTSPYFDSNPHLHDAGGPPVIPVPNGMGGFMLAAGVNPDGTPVLGTGASHMSPPPPSSQLQHQQQSMGMSMNGWQGQRFPHGSSALSSHPQAHPAPAPPPPARPSWAQGSAPPAWLTSSSTATATATATPSQAHAQPPPTYASPYVMPHLVQQGGIGGGPPPGSGQYYGPQPPMTLAPLHNTTEMTRETLTAVLDHFSETLEDYFDLEPPSSRSSPHYGTPPHLTPPYGVASGSGSGNAEASGSGGEKRKRRPTTLRMAVHGGACMLLHQGFHSLSLDLPLTEPSHNHSDAHARGGGSGRQLHMSELPRRTTTRDVDIILRGFVADYGALGPPPNPGERLRRVPTYPGEGQPNDPNPDAPTRVVHMDAASRLKACIRNTTKAFPGLGLDWMNADADVALPLGADPQTTLTFDPLHRSTFTSNNISLFTVYTSPNKRLMLVSVPPYWSIALKISRWGKRDWADVGILLRAGTLLSHTQWTEETLMEWLKKNCWAMGYAIWEERKVNEMRERVRAAIGMIEGWEPGFTTHHSQVQRPQERERERERERDRTEPRMAAPGHTGMPVAVRENVRDWGSKEEKKRSKSRPRARSKSIGPPEIFIPPDDDVDDGGYDGSYGYRDVDEPRGRAHHQPHHSHHSQVMHPPPLVRGPSSGTLSQATAVAPFFSQPQVHSAGGHGQRLWRRQSSRSRNRDNKKAKKAKLRDRQRRQDHQRRTEIRSEYTVPSESESESESEESEDDSDEDNEEDKENRDRGRAWRQSNIYGPSKKRPTPLNVPDAFGLPPPPNNPFFHQPQQHQQGDREMRQPFYAQPPQQQQVFDQRDGQMHWQQQQQQQQQRPPMFAQPHLQSQHQHQSSPRPPPPAQAPPVNADPATLAQFQFEEQMRSLEFERQREQQVRETMGRIAGRVMARGRV